VAKLNIEFGDWVCCMVRGAFEVRGWRLGHPFFVWFDLGFGFDLDLGLDLVIASRLGWIG
jgi:hypothetical protein